MENMTDNKHPGNAIEEQPAMKKTNETEIIEQISKIMKFYKGDSNYIIEKIMNLLQIRQ